MALSVGPIQHYTASNSWFNLSKYDKLGIQERNAVDLKASNLWLIDSSDLFLQSSYSPRVAFINEGAGYQSPVKVSASGNTTGEATVFKNLSGYNSILSNSNGPLWRGDWVQLSEIQGGTQLNFSVIPNGNRAALSTDTRLNPTSPYNPNGPVFWTAYADPKATKPIILLGYEDIAGSGSDNDFNDGILALDVGEANFKAIFSSSNLGQNSKVNLATAKPVPFDLSPSMSLLLLGLFILGTTRRFLKASAATQISFEP
jgi:hypothetical protein